MDESPTNKQEQLVSESNSTIAPGPERLWATVLHLSGLLGLVFPFGNIVAPLVIWLIKRVESPGLDGVGKAVLNFQISWTIYFLGAIFLAMAGSCLILPLIFPFLVGIPMVIFTILGAYKASHGESHRHPLTLKFFL